MKEHNGGEGDIGEAWLVLFPLEELEEINHDYETDKYLPGHIIFGSDGGDELYGVDENGQFFKNRLTGSYIRINQKHNVQTFFHIGRIIYFSDCVTIRILHTVIQVFKFTYFFYHTCSFGCFIF